MITKRAIDSPIVYDELRRCAAALLRRERSGHTLQPTALVHEAYLRLVRQDRADWRNRAVLRRRIGDHAAHPRRSRACPQDGQTIGPVEPCHPGRRRGADVAARSRCPRSRRRVGRALDLRSSQWRVAELRFFGGLSLEEIGVVLDISVATTMRDWQVARAWLFRRLNRAKAVRITPPRG